MLNSIQEELLSGSPLFMGVAAEKIGGFIREIGAAPRKFEAGAAVLEQGDRQLEICLVLSGVARGEKVTADGRSIIVNEFMPGALFGEMLSGALEKSPVRVLMIKTGDIISIPFSALIDGSGSYSEVRERVLRNLIGEISSKYFSLMRRLDMLLIPTLRGKITNYLLGEAKANDKSITSCYTREEQAKLMDCDRSALSRELSRMRAEGIIDYKGRRFEIVDMEKLKKASQ